MAFDSPAKFLLRAAQKYRLKDQALSSLVLERCRHYFAVHHPNAQWTPAKFADGKLTLEVASSSAASDLFLRTHDLLEELLTLDIPGRIEHIEIRQRKERRTW